MPIRTLLNAVTHDDREGGCGDRERRHNVVRNELCANRRAILIAHGRAEVTPSRIRRPELGRYYFKFRAPCKTVVRHASARIRFRIAGHRRTTEPGRLYGGEF